MSLNELIERSTIEFEEELTLEQTEELMHHIAKNMPALVNYAKTERKYINWITGVREEQLTSIDLGGTILNKAAQTDSFNCESSYKENESKVKAIKFQLIPGYTLEQHSKETVKLWDETREQVEKYFAQKK